MMLTMSGHSLELAFSAENSTSTTTWELINYLVISRT